MQSPDWKPWPKAFAAAAKDTGLHASQEVGREAPFSHIQSHIQLDVMALELCSACCPDDRAIDCIHNRDVSIGVRLVVAGQQLQRTFPVHISVGKHCGEAIEDLFGDFPCRCPAKVWGRRTACCEPVNLQPKWLRHAAVNTVCNDATTCSSKLRHLQLRCSGWARSLRTAGTSTVLHFVTRAARPQGFLLSHSGSWV